MGYTLVNAKVAAAATLAVSICVIRVLWGVLTNPPGIPSPTFPPFPGDGIMDRYLKRFLLQHFYVMRKGESMLHLLQWTRLFNERPFLMRIFFRRHIVISKAADIEEVLLRQESCFSKRSGYDRLRVMIGNGLLAMGDKEKHRKHRRILETIFRPTNVKDLANGVMRVHVLRLLGTFLELCRRAGDGVTTVNLSDYVRRMTFSVVAEAAFHASGDDAVSVLNAFLVMTRLNKLNCLCPYYRTAAQRDAEAILMKLSNLLMQRSLESGEPQRWVALDDVLMDELNVHFDKVDFLGHLITFLFAGQDTTSNTLHFLFALLARDEKVQQCLYDELVSVMPFPCICPTIEELMECEYLTAVVRESMRLFPAAPLVYRDADRDVHLPASDVTLQKGSVCVVNIFGVHRSVKIYGEDADVFRPERWLGEEGKELRVRCGRCGYIPFSTGNRNCIGKTYGLYEVILTTAVLVRHLRLASVGSFPRMQFAFTMTSPDPCRVKVLLRDDISHEAVSNSMRLLREHEAATASPAIQNVPARA
ncbi:cytochrome p450-like protein [Trypanosoma conorhini]|uniref:Cytochrome p450-like protein n=1 Tax=Trypanosoma conorhini TaxID=83891 RepID=A0A3R7S1X0_9TRYP|nr:cytochrome p450-like protein [Trypanosoma conorhini]RNF19434.1 cytochrome p450-like protein [Trypanosoma conorhini]